MSLVTLNELLRDAQKRGYAVGSFNMVSFGFLNGILEAAEEEKSPVILSIAEVHLPHMRVEQFIPAAIHSAQNAGVPVAIHLDHGFHFDTVVKAIRWGFSSVMYDGSNLNFEENLETTKLVARIAKAAGVSVEAELGKVGGEEASVEGVPAKGVPAEEASGGGSPEDTDKNFTDPALAARFVEETGIDALAVSVGNAHGFYKSMPKLDYDLVKRIREKVNVPLVLHGGTGIPDESFIKAIRLGICKINFFTGMSFAAVMKVKDFIKTDPKGYEWIALEAKNAIRDIVRERIRIFGSSGRGRC
jgi:fructose-bisphosphate aldolase class II